MSEVIAFLGTGLMGAPMAARLAAAAYDVRVWNRTAAKAAGIAGAQPATTSRDAVAGAGIICLCMTDAQAIEAVLFGPDRTVDTLAAGALVIDFSTIGPAAARGLASRVAAVCGADWLDCPVSGGVAGAEAGRLVMLAGGTEAALARAAPLLAYLSKRVTRMGGVGAGQAAKLCNQLIVSAGLAAIAEAIGLGEALGVNVARLPEALAGGFADSLPLQLFGGRMAAAVDPGPRTGEIHTMAKDVATILAAASAEGAATPLSDRVAELYRRVIAEGHGGEDFPALTRLYRSAAS